MQNLWLRTAFTLQRQNETQRQRVSRVTFAAAVMAASFLAQPGPRRLFALVLRVPDLTASPAASSFLP